MAGTGSLTQALLSNEKVAMGYSVLAMAYSIVHTDVAHPMGKPVCTQVNIIVFADTLSSPASKSASFKPKPTSFGPALAQLWPCFRHVVLGSQLMAN